MARLPDFVIIGAQKAASTEIMRALGRHPDCTLCPDEAHFFRDPMYDERRLPEFVASLPTATTSRFGIKCPDYLGHSEVPPRLARDLERPDLIACLRNPIDRAVSAYHWYVRWGLLPLREVNEGLARLLDGDPALPPIAGEVLEYGLYAQHLQMYRSVFPASCMHVVLHDDLKTDYTSTVANLLHFLNLESSAVAPRPSGSNPGVYAPMRLRLLRARNRYLIHWSEDRSHAEIVKPRRAWPWLFSNSVAASDRWVLARLVANDRPSLDPALRQRLASYYADDIARLQVMLGKDLEAWTVAS